jgi:hypothetical protein
LWTTWWLLLVDDAAVDDDDDDDDDDEAAIVNCSSEMAWAAISALDDVDMTQIQQPKRNPTQIDLEAAHRALLLCIMVVKNVVEDDAMARFDDANTVALRLCGPTTRDTLKFYAKCGFLLMVSVFGSFIITIE